TRSLDELLDDMISAYRHQGLPEGRVLVFATTYYPDAGAAEARLAALAELMPETEFHIVTTKFRAGLKRTERFNNVTVYRIGLGLSLDKYLLPVLGAFKARSLGKRYKFRFAWSLMASYGALAGVALKLLGSNASFIIAHDASELYSGWKERLAHWAAARADHSYKGTEMEKTNELIKEVRKNYHALTMKQEGKLAKPVGI
ncbi:MAG: hypothetical protein Q8P19_03120, partial [bacterium]|nr:hypothetical protein [bacterium]